MTTRDITSASRNLLIIYWVVSAFCSYQLGIVLRIAANLADLSTFFLGFMSLVIIPILMASSLVLYIYISEAYLAHLAKNPHPHRPHLDFGLPDSMAYG